MTKIKSKSDSEITLQFSMRDTGIGMTEGQAARLFQAFSQADTSTTRKYGGTGLGLTISKCLVNMMDGDIWVESEFGQGTTFSFTAKFGLGEETAKKGYVPAPDLCGMKVLVVDDNSTARDILREMLESFTFEVTAVASGPEGITEIENAAGERPFELVVMDWKMPGMDGIEAIKRIKDHEGLNKIPAIILVAAYGREEIMQQADALGLEGFLLKPVNPLMLFDTIVQAFGEAVPETSRIAQGSEQKAEALEHIRGANVLLVEDNEINQQVAKEILEGEGLIVTLAANGQAGVNAIKKSNYDVVLMDLQMPVMDGYTATKKIRQQLSQKDLPIIAMTADAMSGVRERTASIGMNDYVSKPIDPVVLFRVLLKWIRPAERVLPREYAKQHKAQEQDNHKQPLPDLPGIDTKSGLARCGGNILTYKKLLIKFIDNHKEADQAIRDSLNSNRLQDAARFVHTLKGVSGNIGADELHAAAETLEVLLKDKDLNKSQKALDELSEVLDQTVAVLKSVSTVEANTEVEEHQKRGFKEIDPAFFVPLLSDLKGFLEEFNSEAEAVLSEVLAKVKDSKMEPELIDLQRKMNRYDFEGALKQLAVVCDRFHISL